MPLPQNHDDNWHSHHPTTGMSNCSWDGNRCPKQWDNVNTATRPKETTMQQRDGMTGGQRGQGGGKKKKAQKTSNNVLCAIGRLFFQTQEDNKMMRREMNNRGGEWKAGRGKQNDGEKGNRTKGGPGSIIDIPWATGKFFFLTHFIFI